VHFIVPLIFIVNFVSVFGKWRGLIFSQSLIAISISIFLFGLFWEIFEFSSEGKSVSLDLMEKWIKNIFIEF